MAKKSSKTSKAKPAAKAAVTPAAKPAKTIYRLCESADGRQFIGECGSAAAATKMAAEYQLKNAVNVEVARGKVVGGKFQSEFTEVIPLRDLAGTVIDPPPAIAVAEPTAAQTVEAENDAKPTAKSPAKPKRAAKEPRAKARPVRADKRLSALDAAAKVLGDAGKPMNCQDLIAKMAERKLWSSPNGKTPAATLYAAILREINVKGKDARFKKTDRGQFAHAH